MDLRGHQSWRGTPDDSLNLPVTPLACDGIAPVGYRSVGASWEPMKPFVLGGSKSAYAATGFFLSLGALRVLVGELDSIDWTDMLTIGAFLIGAFTLMGIAARLVVSTDGIETPREGKIPWSDVHTVEFMASGSSAHVLFRLRPPRPRRPRGWKWLSGSGAVSQVVVPLGRGKWTLSQVRAAIEQRCPDGLTRAGG